MRYFAYGPDVTLSFIVDQSIRDGWRVPRLRLLGSAVLRNFDALKCKWK